MRRMIPRTFVVLIRPPSVTCASCKPTARGGAPQSAAEGQLKPAARTALSRERGSLLVKFEKHLRDRVEERMKGKETEADFSKLDVGEPTLVEHSSMDESVITGNIV